MFEKLKSKKFIAVILTAIIVGVGSQLGVDPETLSSIALVAASFITGQGIADFGERSVFGSIREKVSAFKSRKVLVALASGIVIAVMDYLGIDPGITKWVVAVSAPYLIGEGIADAGQAINSK